MTLKEILFADESELKRLSAILDNFARDGGCDLLLLA